ncbi:MAG: ABC transporter ATP-binding protein [Calditrichia bacterium]
MNDIEIKDFSKNYGETEAVKGVSLSVKKGELFGLIGPDGAGKTSLMRSICTLLVPDSGSIIVNGMDVTKNISGIRAILGYMPQRFSLYQDLTVEQNLRFFADLFQVPVQERKQRLEQLYKFSRLKPFKKRKAGALSGGMKQKLALSCALIHTPKIMVLDEPTFGVDPVSRQEFWDILRSIQKQGTTILVSTAYMDEADQCDRVGLFFNGKINATGTPNELRAQFEYQLYKLQGKNLREIRDFFTSIPVVRNTQLFGDSIHVSFEEKPDETQWKIWQNYTNKNLMNWTSLQPTIEDIFLNLMREN